MACPLTSVVTVNNFVKSGSLSTSAFAKAIFKVLKLSSHYFVQIKIIVFLRAPVSGDAILAYPTMNTWYHPVRRKNPRTSLIDLVVGQLITALTFDETPSFEIIKPKYSTQSVKKVHLLFLA